MVGTEVVFQNLRFAKCCSKLLGTFGQFGFVFFVGESYLGQELCPLLGLEIGPSIERLEVRQQKHIKRPSATNSHVLDGIHVNVVQIRALLPVDLDADKMFVHQLSSCLPLETFVLHDMAPMACRVAYTD